MLDYAICANYKNAPINLLIAVLCNQNRTGSIDEFLRILIRGASWKADQSGPTLPELHQMNNLLTSYNKSYIEEYPGPYAALLACSPHALTPVAIIAVAPRA